MSTNFSSEPGQEVPGVSSPSSSFPPPPRSKFRSKQLKASLTRPWRIVLIVIAILLLAGATLGTLFAFAPKNRSQSTSPVGTVPVVGHVFFVTSEQLYTNNNQGINDEVLVDLHNIPAPAAGKSYYAWLLGDEGPTEAAWVSLGKVNVNKGNVHFLHAGDIAHTNLLNDMSRFLITENDANGAPTSPFLDQASWRYYAEIYQTPSPKDPNHFSFLDHLRHVLVQAPELNALNLPGGLNIWLLRNVQEILRWAVEAKDRSQNINVARTRTLLTNILYYLDGECTQQTDLQGVPPGTPTTPENATIAHIAHFALLNPCVQEEQEQADALKKVFVHIPHNYVDHMLFHMAGVTLSPGAPPALRALAVQINTAVSNMRKWLTQLHTDALILIHMSDTDLAHLSGRDLLGDLELQARYAYAGSMDPSTGNFQGGAVWIFDNVQRLATLDVRPYLSR